MQPLRAKNVLPRRIGCVECSTIVVALMHDVRPAARSRHVSGQCVQEQDAVIDLQLIVRELKVRFRVAARAHDARKLLLVHLLFEQLAVALDIKLLENQSVWVVLSGNVTCIFIVFRLLVLKCVVQLLAEVKMSSLGVYVIRRKVPSNVSIS